MKINLNFTSTLTLVFIILKLVGVINWSWFWVLSPTIFSLALVFGFITLVVILKGLSSK